MTGRVDILRRIFEKIGEKVKNEVSGTEKRRFWLLYLKTFHKSTFLGPVREDTHKKKCFFLVVGPLRV